VEGRSGVEDTDFYARAGPSARGMVCRPPGLQQLNFAHATLTKVDGYDDSVLCVTAEHLSVLPLWGHHSNQVM
jgi:hypothetical protein